MISVEYQKLLSEFYLFEKRNTGIFSWLKNHWFQKVAIFIHFCVLPGWRFTFDEKVKLWSHSKKNYYNQKVEVKVSYWRGNSQITTILLQFIQKKLKIALLISFPCLIFDLVLLTTRKQRKDFRSPQVSIVLFIESLIIQSACT